MSVLSLPLRRCETPPSPPAPDPVGIENCKQLFSPLLASTTQKIATHNTDIIFAVCVAFFSVVNASRNEKSCLQFLIPTVVFHMLLKRCETPPSPPTPDPVSIENCTQLFLPLVTFTAQKITTHSTDIISAVCVAFFRS